MRRASTSAPLLLFAFALFTAITSAQSTAPTPISSGGLNPIPSTIPGVIHGDGPCIACLDKGIATVPACANITLDFGDEVPTSKDQKTCYCAISTAASYDWLNSCASPSTAPIETRLCPADLIEIWTKNLVAAKTGACAPTSNKPNGVEQLAPLPTLFVAAIVTVGVVALGGVL
ncbi:hypothetical protein EC991_006405 [Linnemannia zychae]|nr:hypothetical protein EC991_006405 [Linnemannia zychae]